MVDVGTQYFPRFWTGRLRSEGIVLDGFFVNPSSIAEALLAGALVYAYYRSTLQSDRQKQRLEEELKSAREVQQVLIPEALPTLIGYKLTSAYRPSQEVGGDFFQIIAPVGAQPGSAIIVVGDVSGKGLKAAMAVALIVGMLRSLVDYVSSPARLLTEVNERLCGRMRDSFATCIVVRIDPDMMVLSSAGHLPPLINGRELSVSGSLPLGMDLNAEYEEGKIFLNVGDQIAFYTDGLVEARSGKGELYGFERTQALFSKQPTAADAMEAAVRFGQNDDITVLTLTPVPPGGEATTTLSLSKPHRRPLQRIP